MGLDLSLNLLVSWCSDFLTACTLTLAVGLVQYGFLVLDEVFALGLLIARAGRAYDLDFTLGFRVLLSSRIAGFWLRLRVRVFGVALTEVVCVYRELIFGF